MKKTLLTLIGIAFIIFCISLFLKQPANPKYIPKETIRIGETDVKVEIRDTPEERTMGLSGRESLEEGTGMLFIFETPGNYGFWMKDMKFPIDIIWIDDTQRVIGVEKNAAPESYPKIFYPPREVKYVLEVPAGFSNTHSIDIGQRVSLE